MTGFFYNVDNTIPQEHWKKSGIYIIKNSVNAKVYIGSAVKFNDRYHKHFYLIERGRHHSKHLNAFIKRHGYECLCFNLLELVEDQSQLIAREQYWIDFYSAADGVHGFNATPKAGSRLGYKLTNEQKEHLSKVQKGRKLSPETIAKRIATVKGRKLSEATKEKMRLAAASRCKQIEIICPHCQKTFKAEPKRKFCSKECATKGRIGLPSWNKGIQLSDEYRQKLSDSHKGIKPSEEAVRKRAEKMKGHTFNLGRKLSDEHKQKLSEALKGKSTAWLTGRKQTEEHKQKAADARRVKKKL